MATSCAPSGRTYYDEAGNAVGWEWWNCRSYGYEGDITDRYTQQTWPCPPIEP